MTLATTRPLALLATLLSMAQDQDLILTIFDNVTQVHNTALAANTHLPVESQSVMDFDLTLSERREYPPDVDSIPGPIPDVAFPVSCTIIRNGISTGWECTDALFTPNILLCASQIESTTDHVRVVSLGALLSALYQHCVASPLPYISEYPWIQSFLSDTTFPHGLLFATARVLPPSGVNHRSPEFGYRRLVAPDSLSLVGFQERSHPSSFDLSHDLVSVDPADAAVQELARIWQPLGFCADRHFILYLEQKTSPDTNAITWDEDFQSIQDSSFHPTPDLFTQAVVQQNSSPPRSYASTPHHLGAFVLDTSSTEVPFEQTSLDALLTPGLSIDTVCSVRGVSPELVLDAHFQSRHGCATALPFMARNHAAMVQVLKALGLDPHDPNGSVTYQGGLSLTIIDVLLCFGWTTATFNKRGRVYRAAAAIARCSWPANQVQDDHLYAVWTHITHLWTSEGTLAPQSSVTGMESMAFSQRDLETHYVALQKLLGIHRYS